MPGDRCALRDATRRCAASDMARGTGKARLADARGEVTRRGPSTNLWQENNNESLGLITLSGSLDAQRRAHDTFRDGSSNGCAVVLPVRGALPRP